MTDQRGAQLMTWGLRVGMVLIVVAASLAWVAAGQLGEASAVGLQETSVALDDAVKLAESTAKIAEEVQSSVISIALGMASASEAIGNTVTVSENIRSLLDIVTVFNSVDDLTNSLSNVEASLLEAQGGIDETKDNLIGAEPAIADAVTVLEAVPGQLREARDKIASAAERVDDHIALWRTMIVLLAIGALLLFAAVEWLSRRVRVSAEEPAAVQP